jgi:hypothetical protein
VFGADENRQTVHAFYFAALTALQSFCTNVTRRPRAPTQLRFADPVDGYVFHGHTCLADKAVNPFLAFTLRELKEFSAKQPEGQDRYGGE